MSSLIDSEAVFRQRSQELKLSETTWSALKERNWCTYANLAFASVFAPNATTEHESFVHEILTPILGDGDHQEAPILRRLWYETQIATTAEMKRVAGEDSEQGRKLAPAERARRMEEFRAKYSGTIVEGESEPAHGLIDKYLTMFEENAMKW
eukprot:1061222-Amphidinium_carterae.1